MSAKQEIDSILNDEEKLATLSKLAFDKIDTNRNGYIEIAEMTQILREVASEVGTDATQAEIEEVFWEVDLNGDGVIGVEEFKHFIFQLVQHIGDELGK